tara:strand:+ start:502 stop:981 length:480 start_codon:yes stop_codon:yes gene_type:complete
MPRSDTATEKLGQSLEGLHRALDQARARSGNDGLSASELAYLRAIEHLQHTIPVGHDGEDGPHISELADRLGVRRASASAMLKKLEAAKLTKRVACRYDARAQHILLTAPARAALSSQPETYAELTRKISDRLSTDELVQLTGILGRCLAEPSETDRHS